MVNKIWLFLFIVGIVFALINNRIPEVNNALLSSPHDSVMIIINLTGLYILWNGFLQIAKDCGLIDAFAKKISFLTKFIFPDIPQGHEAHGLIAGNIAANMLGLGSVATPLGIKAMESMKKLSGDNDTASRSMITLILLNTACLTILPTSIVSLRKIYGSKNPTIVIPYIFLVTLVSTVIAIITEKVFYRLNKRKF